MAEAARKKILIVDDEEATLSYLCRILERENYKVFSTTKGKEVFDLAANNRPDVIVLDIILPDIDGGEVASLLSKNAATSNIPIIFLTGILTKSEESFAGKTGKRYVLAKPIAKEKLLEMIQKVLSE
ncbi:MAG: response regulator [Candidatus Omnitrophica bacterium]|jgi:CheY-like chemotaxis protein|nr:response regulator [Candidatus Omnitrophota bacterium]